MEDFSFIFLWSNSALVDGELVGGSNKRCTLLETMEAGGCFNGVSYAGYVLQDREE